MIHLLDYFKSKEQPLGAFVVEKTTPKTLKMNSSQYQESDLPNASYRSLHDQELQQDIIN